MLIMNSVWIGKQAISIKDYYCDAGNGYIHRGDGKLWLYVNITDKCNGKCPFCINPSCAQGNNPFNLNRLKKILPVLRDYVYGVSITGGEPMLDPHLMDDTVKAVVDVFDHSVEIDIVTNGTNLTWIPSLSQLKSIDSIHLSRHRIDDEENRGVLGFEAPSSKDIRQVLDHLEDPGKIVLNCVLMRDGVDSAEKLSEYLEWSADLGIQNTSFIGLSRCNDYCTAHYVDPEGLDLSANPHFRIWNHVRDHDFCSCSSGSYQARKGCIRFYYRRLGSTVAWYTRQLVYAADNRLLAGFGGKEIEI